MICPNCGNETREGSRFCSKCGCGLDIDLNEDDIQKSDDSAEPISTISDSYNYVSTDEMTDPGKKRKKKIIIAVIVIAVIAAAVIAWNVFNADRIRTGDIIVFGSYEQDNDTSNGKEPIEWIVLKKEEGKVLLLSRYALDCQPYNNDRADVTWETCTLRSWLNSDFLNDAFSAGEKDQIYETEVKNPDSFIVNDGDDMTADNVGGNTDHESCVDGGNDTKDRVFLLSIDEAENLLGYDKKDLISDKGSAYSGYPGMQAACTDHSKAQGTWRSGNLNDEGEACCYWWLRSPGISSQEASTVGSDGKVCVDSHVDAHDGAVRPAIWIVDKV